MPSRAKRFYLCNLIPLWEIDEPDMDVDWPFYHAYFGDLIDMRAAVKRRQIRWAGADGTTPAADLKIRFEVYESDFLLSGGLNDRMAVYSSAAGFGDDPQVRPLKVVADFDAIPAADREKFIFIRWADAHDVSVTKPDGTKQTTSIPDTLEIRCFWRVVEDEGGDVSGDPEYYYDVYVEGKLRDGSDVSLNERADHEIVGFAWHATNAVRQGRVTSLVDGEYAYLKMLQLLDGAQHSIHVLNWKLDPQAMLVVEPRFRADYLQVPGLDEAGFDALLLRCKPLVLGVGAGDGLVYYGASNGNLVAAKQDGSALVAAAQQIDDPTNLDLPAGIHVLASNFALVLDQLRSRLLLYGVVDRSALQGGEAGIHVVALPPVTLPNGSTLQRILPFFSLVPTITSDPALVGGFIPLAGDGNPGYADGGLVFSPLDEARTTGMMVPAGKLNRPTGVVAAAGAIFITDTVNHCVRKVDHFDTSDIDGSLATRLELTTLAGQPIPGDAAGTGAAARFRSPTGIAWDSVASRLLVADTGNAKIRAINPSTGAVTTLAIAHVDKGAPNLHEVFGLAFEASRGAKGTLYVSERDRHRILAVDLDTLEATTNAGASGVAGYKDGPAAGARFNRPLGLAFDGGTLFVADSENRVVRAIDLSPGTVRTIGSTTTVNPPDVPVVLADVLRRKAADGVEIRILMDGVGSGISRNQIGGSTSLVSIEGSQTAADLRFYDERIQPFVQDHVQRVEEGFFGLVPKRQTLASNHEKMLVVDGKHGVTGGIDFAPDKQDGVPHFRRHRFSMFWHDVAALVEGKAAFGLEEQFARRWQMLRDELFKEEEAHREERLPSLTGAVACFTVPLRHYESVRLPLDATCSKPPPFESIQEYRWEILRRYPKGDAFEEVSIGRTTVTDASVELLRRLDAGQYRIRLRVSASNGKTDSTERLLDVLPAPPDDLQAIDRTDPAISDAPVESVRTWNPSPIFINLTDPVVKEILDSYRRGILGARHYVYMEHQYIYYPELGDYLAEALEENRQLQVIWLIPFLTEETQDPYGELAELKAKKGLATSITDTAEFKRAGMGSYGQMRSQIAWHGFFRQKQMVDRFQKIDASRSGVFSIQRFRNELPTPQVEQIYPHTKLLMADDRFVCVGSANANGRGMVTDGEHNVTTLSQAAGRALRERLWGEHLGYSGLAAVDLGGLLLPLNGHHLSAGDHVELAHQTLGTRVDRVVDAVDATSGAIRLVGAPLDPAAGPVAWRDPRLGEMPLTQALRFWRGAAHPIATFRAITGSHARTNAAGALIVPGNQAVPGDKVHLGKRYAQIDKEDSVSSEPVIRRLIQVELEVASVAGDAITFAVATGDVEDVQEVAATAIGSTVDRRPLRLKVVGRPSAGVARVEVRLMPNLTEVPFDYKLSWYGRQPGARRLVRAWEIDPPPGIEYAGPGSLLFSRWLVLPRLFIHFDPDEQARLDAPVPPVRLA
jgi:phosphatidylserine/phosphatidylglycerophosphate/cardiolipin synthase-like enzyme